MFIVRDQYRIPHSFRSAMSVVHRRKGRKSVHHRGSGAVARLSRRAHPMLMLPYSYDEPSLTVGLLPRYRTVLLTSFLFDDDILLD